MRTFQYKMSEEMTNSLLKARKGTEKKIEKQKYLCRWVNKELNIMGKCTEVLTTL